MNPYNATLNYPDLIRQLHKHCLGKVTGTVFVKTNCEHLARFIIDEGAVVSCVYRHKSGYEAIPLIREIESGSFRFSDHPVEGLAFPPMPDSDEFFQLLKDSNDHIEADCDQAQGVDITPENSAALTAIKQELKNYIGPMADIVCHHYLENRQELLHPGRLDELIDMLAENIANEQERSEFRRSAMLKISAS